MQTETKMVRRAAVHYLTYYGTCYHNVREYTPGVLKNGKVVWRLRNTLSTGWTRKHITDSGYPIGGLHNKPLTDDEQAEYLTAVAA